MKKITILTLISIFTLIFTSCKKSDDSAIDSEIEEPTTSEYYISYKANGTLINETVVSGLRGSSTTPRTLSIIGTGKDGANPKFKFLTTESFIGFVAGLNIGCSSNSSTSHYVEYTNSAALLHSTALDNDGIYVFISQISYTNGGTVKGSFNGSVKNANGGIVNITDGQFNVKFSN